MATKKVSAKHVQVKKKEEQRMPICFDLSQEDTEKLVHEHPGLCPDLTKPVLKFLADVGKISEKHGVPLGFHVSFVITGEVSNGQ